MRRGTAHHTIDDIVIAFHRVVTDRHQFIHQLFQISCLRHRPGFHFLQELDRFIRKLWRFIHSCVGFFQQRQLFIQCLDNVVFQFIHIFRIELIECVLAVQSVPVYPYDIAAFGRHRGIGNRLGKLRDHDGESNGVRRQNTYIVISLLKPLNQLFHGRSDRIQILRKYCLHTFHLSALRLYSTVLQYASGTPQKNALRLLPRHGLCAILLKHLWRSTQEAEGTGFENQQTCERAGVRIPPSPVTDIAAAYPCGFFVSAPDAAQFLRRF